LEFNRIFHVFNVRFVTFVRRSLTSRFQTELGIPASDTRQGAPNKHTVASDVHPNSSNTETIVPDIRRDVSNVHPTVFHVRSYVANIRTTVPDIHRNKLKSRGDVDGKNQAVSTTRTLPVTE